MRNALLALLFTCTSVQAFPLKCPAPVIVNPEERAGCKVGDDQCPLDEALEKLLDQHQKGCEQRDEKEPCPLAFEVRPSQKRMIIHCGPALKGV
jgi:hypothetical protein